VVVDELRAGPHRARLAVEREREMRERIAGDLGVPGSQLAPGDAPVTVRVDADRVLEVAQRDVPLAVDPRAVYR
jgi:hypothetical protein